jgi:hypothetical protein
MVLEFDEAKNARNIRLRGTGFDAFANIDVDTAISSDDTREDYGESRMRVVGFIEGRLQAAVITPRGGRIRVISLRRANRRERKRGRTRCRASVEPPAQPGAAA